MFSKQKIGILAVLVVVSAAVFFWQTRSLKAPNPEPEVATTNSSTTESVQHNVPKRPPARTETINESNVEPNSPVGLANPASVNCMKSGGTLKIESNELGQYGLCYFEDNRACEEWALFRGECPVGGVKTTGYDTIDQKFCAWSGGSTLAVPDSKCTFKNGKVCSTLDFYNGKCSRLVE